MLCKLGRLIDWCACEIDTEYILYPVCVGMLVVWSVILEKNLQSAPCIKYVAFEYSLKRISHF